MSDTAIVALISSLSAITGAIVASATSIIIHRTQIAAQERLYDQERSEQRRARQREVRREAYVQLLARFNDIDNVMQRCWQLHPIPRDGQSLPEVIEEASTGIESITAVLNIVILEGPQAVAEAGASANDTLRSELSTIIDRIMKLPDTQTPLVVLANDDFGRALHHRHQAKQVLLETAQAALKVSL